MKKSEYIARGFMHAVGVFAYVFAVAWVLFNGKNLFGEAHGLFVPVFMLLLLIVSATITGLLVLGKPIYLYFSGFKKEAIVLLLATLGWLEVFLLSVATALLLR